jgi:hypothetical protein
MWIELSIQKKKVIVGTGYRPPRQTHDEAMAFMDDYRSSLTDIMARGAESIIIRKPPAPKPQPDQQIGSGESVNRGKGCVTGYRSLVGVSGQKCVPHGPSSWGIEDKTLTLLSMPDQRMGHGAKLPASSHAPIVLPYPDWRKA